MKMIFEILFSLAEQFSIIIGGYLFNLLVNDHRSDSVLWSLDLIIFILVQFGRKLLKELK
jgi:hypothetical protein